jgi:hypothetical protein
MRSRKGFLVAGIVAATGALICCAGPLVVLAIGDLGRGEPGAKFDSDLVLAFSAVQMRKLM